MHYLNNFLNSLCETCGAAKPPYVLHEGAAMPPERQRHHHRKKCAHLHRSHKDGYTQGGLHTAHTNTHTDTQYHILHSNNRANSFVVHQCQAFHGERWKDTQLGVHRFRRVSVHLRRSKEIINTIRSSTNYSDKEVHNSTISFFQSVAAANEI